MALKVENSFSLGFQATMFQVEIYTVLERASKNSRCMYKRRCIHILSDSKAPLKALYNPKKLLRLLVEC